MGSVLDVKTLKKFKIKFEMKRNISDFEKEYLEEESNSNNQFNNYANETKYIQNIQNERMRLIFQKLESLRNPFYEEESDQEEEDLSSKFYNSLQLKINNLSLKLTEGYVKEQSREIMGYLD
jgi:hypothetical protein